MTAGKTSIAFLSQYFWPEETATSEMVSGVAFKLAQRGMEVSAVAGQPSYHGAAKLERRMESDGVSITRIWSTQFDKNRTLGRVINTATFTIAAFSHILFRRQPDTWMAVTNPPLLPWVLCLAGLLRGTPFVLNIHDVYPDIAVALGRVKSGGAIDKTWRLLNRWAYRRAAKIIALDESMAVVLKKSLPAEQHGKIVTIANWANDTIVPMERADHPLLSEWGLAEKFVIQYSGNIGLFHDIETIVEAATRLQDEGIEFLFIGRGGQADWLGQTVAERELSNVTFKPFQPKEALPLSLTACDAAFVTLKPEATGLCVPSKLFGVLAAGKPVLAVMESAGEAAQIAQNESCGFAIRPGDVDGLVEAIRKLKNDAQLLDRMGQQARRVFEQRHTLQAITDHYERLFESVAKDSE